MIVNSGKTQIKQFFGGQVTAIGNALAFGSGTTPETVADAALQAEVYRVPISSVSPDLDNSRIVFRAVIQPGFLSSFTELGLFYGSTDNTPGGTLIARVTFATPQTVDVSIPTEVEYSLVVTV